LSSMLMVYTNAALNAMQAQMLFDRLRESEIAGL